MPLVNMKGLLAEARSGRYAVAMFDVSDAAMIRNAVEMAEAERAPVILAALEPDIAGSGLGYWLAAAKFAAEGAEVPVCLHIDHAIRFDQIERVVKAGFTSVMLDASSEDFETNVRLSAEVAAFAKGRGVSVEAELGHVGDGIAGSGESAATGHSCSGGALTEPDKVAEFVERTGVDALAVSIGTAHGVYASTPKLDIELLKRINEVSPAPLVLHGGSGTPEDQIRAAIANGICKVNIYSELLDAWNRAMLENLKSLKNMSSWPSVVRPGAETAQREVMRAKIRLFGSNGKA